MSSHVYIYSSQLLRTQINKCHSCPHTDFTIKIFKKTYGSSTWRNEYIHNERFPVKWWNQVRWTRLAWQIKAESLPDWCLELEILSQQWWRLKDWKNPPQYLSVFYTRVTRRSPQRRGSTPVFNKKQFANTTTALFPPEK